LWALATGRTFTDKSSKPTIPRWNDLINPVKSVPKKVTKKDVKNQFMRLKK
jgi:hypothetical protein